MVSKLAIAVGVLVCVVAYGWVASPIRPVVIHISGEEEGLPLPRFEGALARNDNMTQVHKNSLTMYCMVWQGGGGWWGWWRRAGHQFPGVYFLFRFFFCVKCLLLPSQLFCIPCLPLFAFCF